MQRFKILLITLLCSIGIGAAELSEQAKISLISCAPGAELYTRYGHTAIRVQDPDWHWDVVFNYGSFDFDTEHFYWKFMRGETWYELSCVPTNAFLAEYRFNKRTVYEQELNLTQEQKQQLLNALIENHREQNRSYLYNFVFDNCATRPYLLIKKTLGGNLSSPVKNWEGKTYREYLSHYSGKNSWTDFGINLLFGRKADQPMSVEESLFLPEEVMCYLQEAQLADGQPLVADSHIGSFDIPAVPWYKTWYVGYVLFILLLGLLTWYDRRRQHWTIAVDIVLGVVYTLVLLLVGFLVFFSLHPLVGFGWRLLIFPITHLCVRLSYFIPLRS